MNEDLDLFLLLLLAFLLDDSSDFELFDFGLLLMEAALSL